MRKKILLSVVALIAAAVAAGCSSTDESANPQQCDTALLVAFSDGASSEQIADARNAVDDLARRALGDQGWQFLSPATQLEGGAPPPTLNIIVDGSLPSGQLMYFYQTLLSTPQHADLEVQQVLLQPTSGTKNTCETN